MDELTNAIDIAANSLSLTDRGWNFLRRYALPRLGTIRKRSGDSELRSSITAPDGTSWQFETRSSDDQVRNGLAIAKEAFENLGSEDYSEEDLEDEWQDRFWDDAKRKYTQDAQSTYARILAGELRHPGSVSKMSLSVLDDLDAETAKTFQRYCTLSAQFGDLTALMHVTSTMDCMANALAEFGVSYVDIGRLAEHDLVRDTSARLPAERYCIRTTNIGRIVSDYFSISGVAYALEPVSGMDYKDIDIVMATSVGNELSQMIEQSTDVNIEVYTSKLFREIEKMGTKVIRVNLD